METKKINFGELFFADLDSNAYLREVYQHLLREYGKWLTGDWKRDRSLTQKEIDDLLTFSDLLSKSVGTDFTAKHQSWALDIVESLRILFPEQEEINYYLYNILRTTNNAIGLQNEKAYLPPNIEDQIVFEYEREMLAVPGENGVYFYPDQKKIYDSLESRYSSFSAPTSMGKTFIMETFIAEKVKRGCTENFAILVPTKALINELSSSLIWKINGEEDHSSDVKVVTNVNSRLLKKDTNFVFVVTPERLLYILLNHPTLKIDYLFIDEAYKMSAEEDRSAFYFKVIEKVQNRNRKANIYFSSPYIPNPDVYFESLGKQTKLEATKSVYHTNYSPVAQRKFLINPEDYRLEYYDQFNDEFITVGHLRKYSKYHLIWMLSKHEQSLVYCKSKISAISLAREFADFLSNLEPYSITDSDQRVLNTLSEKIKHEVHSSFYLAETIKQGVAYHIGYLPASIRVQIEDLYKKGIIKIIFCTSTLLEGVNLPAKSLFITSSKKGRSNLSEVDFKNLLGRAGRSKFGLSGDIFVFPIEDDKYQSSLDKARLYLEKEIDKQELSITTKISDKQFAEIKAILLNGTIEISKTENDHSYDNYDLKRKILLILQNGIVRNIPSGVVDKFSNKFTPDEISQIRDNYSKYEKRPSDDINISYDQVQSLKQYVKSGHRYPKLDYSDFRALLNKTDQFLRDLANIFKWDIYEADSFGQGRDYNSLKWYRTLLLQWMEGHGINYILNRVIDYHKNGNRMVYKSRFDRTPEEYNGSDEHNNRLISNTLEAINSALLFKLSKYFLRFSEEIKHQEGVEEIENDWYKYLEFGSTNQDMIFLQEVGFTRDTSSKISKTGKYIRLINSQHYINKLILESDDEDIKREANDVFRNIPEIFMACDD